jgi:hypothetical protein
MAYRALQLDPAGLLAFLVDRARARIYDFPETVPDSRNRQMALRNPYEFLHLKRFLRIVKNHHSPAGASLSTEDPAQTMGLRSRRDET